jgi:hypothetical protein
MEMSGQLHAPAFLPREKNTLYRIYKNFGVRNFYYIESEIICR